MPGCGGHGEGPCPAGQQRAVGGKIKGRRCGDQTQRRRAAADGSVHSSGRAEEHPRAEKRAALMEVRGGAVESVLEKFQAGAMSS